MKQYVQTDLEADREVANTLADLIIGGLLVTEDTIERTSRRDEPRRLSRKLPCTNPLAQLQAKARLSVREPGL